MTVEGRGVFDATPVPRTILNETRTLIAIGDPAREVLVLRLLAESSEDGPPLRLVRRCLDAEQLSCGLQTDDVDVAIVSADLHGFGANALNALARVRKPIVLWSVKDGSAPEVLSDAPVTILPRDVDLAELRAALRGLGKLGGRLQRPSVVDTVMMAELKRSVMPGYSAAADNPAQLACRGTVIALVGAFSGQGASVLAAGLAAALGRDASTALVDLNLELPSQALALDLNPARNLYMVLHEAGTRDDPSLWARLLESELQPLDPSTPRAAVLAGIPGSSLAASVGADGVRQLLRELATHEQYVVADVGSTVHGQTPVASAHRAALDVADRIFVVACADLVGLRRAAKLLEDLRMSLGDRADRLALVLNHHQRKHHHDPVEVARALRTTIAAVIPADANGIHAALAAQRPLVAFGRSRRGSAGRALLELARSVQDATTAHAARGASNPTRLRFRWPRPPGALAWQWRRA